MVDRLRSSGLAADQLIGQEFAIVVFTNAKLVTNKDIIPTFTGIYLYITLCAISVQKRCNVSEMVSTSVFTKTGYDVFPIPLRP